MIFDIIGKSRLHTAIFILIIFMMLPNPAVFPMGYLFALSVVIFKRNLLGRDHDLGLSLTVSAVGKKYILIILGAILAINGLFFLIVTYIKYRAFIESPWEVAGLTQVSYDLIDGWGPDPAIHQALVNVDMGAIFMLSIKPLIRLSILAPLAESIIVFNIVMSALANRLRKRKLIWVTAAIFTAGHILPFHPVGLIIIGLTALPQAWLCVRSQSLYPTIVFHACWNTTLYAFVTIINLGMPYGQM